MGCLVFVGVSVSVYTSIRPPSNSLPGSHPGFSQDIVIKGKRGPEPLKSCETLGTLLDGSNVNSGLSLSVLQFHFSVCPYVVLCLWGGALVRFP